MAAESSISPEPGFPKRRLTRLTVPNDPNDMQQCSGIPSCHSEAERGSWRAPTPPLSATQRRAPRLSKPGYQPDPAVFHTVWSILSLLLLVTVAAVSNHRQKQLSAVVSALQQKHMDDMNLQVAWLAASMTEHEQCKVALERADADYQVAKAGMQACELGLHSCELDRKQSSSKSEQVAASHRVATAQLQVQLDSAKKHLKEATDRLKKVQGELSAAQQQAQQQQAQVQALQQEKEQLAKDKGQLTQALAVASAHVTPTPALTPVDSDAPHTAATAAAIKGSHQHTDSGSSSDVPIVTATCSAADLTPVDMITPWCEAVVAAGVPRVMVVSEEAACAAAAKAAGIKVLQHTFQVPDIQGPLAQQNARAYRRYAALQQVLSLGHAAVSVDPDVLLLSDPLALLHQHPTDVTVMSTASNDEHMAYGHVVGSTAGYSSTAHPTFRISALSPALLYLKPQQPALAFVTAMMQGLAGGQHSESALLNSLLLPPWHIHSSPADSAAADGAPSDAADGSSHSSGQSSGSREVPPLSLPVAVGVLPPALFTSSKVVFGAKDPKAWLKQQQPVAVQLLPGPNRGTQVKTVLDWLEADIQEVIQMLGHVPEGTEDQAGSGMDTSDLSGSGSRGSSSNARKVAGEVTSKEDAAAQGQQQQQQAGQKAHEQASGADGHLTTLTSHKGGGAGGEVQQEAQHTQKHHEERKLQERTPVVAAGVTAAAAAATKPAVTSTAVPAAAVTKPMAAAPVKHAIGTPAAAPLPAVGKGAVTQQPPNGFGKLPAKQRDGASKLGHKAEGTPAPAAAALVKPQRISTGNKAQLQHHKQPTATAAAAAAVAPDKQGHKASTTRSMLQPPPLQPLPRQQQHNQQQQQAEENTKQQPKEQKQSLKKHRKQVH